MPSALFDAVVAQRALAWPATLAVLAPATACAGSAADREPSERWTVRPAQPQDPYSFYAADDAPEVCELSGPPSSASADVVVFHDEFMGAHVDPERWNVADTYVGYASSLNASSPDNARVSDGSLILVSDKSAPDEAQPFVSAALDTRGKFARTYGKIEFRGRFGAAPGVWYALVGRPWTGDYPVVRIEVVNRASGEGTQVYLTHEWAADSLPDEARKASTRVDDLDVTQDHVYTIIWGPEAIEWQIDGGSRMHSTDHGVAAAPTYWTLGGWVGGWPGAPPEGTAFPVQSAIDYFQVSRVDGVTGEPALAVSNPKASYLRDEALEFQLANFDEACARIDIYEGEWRFARRTTPPYRLSLAKVSHGDHSFSFVATDGTRIARTSLDLHVD